MSYTYTEWYPDQLGPASYISLIPQILASPSDFWGSINDINSYGTWSFGRSSTTPVTGIMLWIAWIGEIVLLAAMTLLVSVNRVKKPFIEAENEWAKEYKEGIFAFESFDIKANQMMIEENPSFILGARPFYGDFAKSSYVQVDLFHSSDFMENYITLNQVKYDQKAKKLNKTPVITYLRTDSTFFHSLYGIFNGGSSGQNNANNTNYYS